METKDVKEIREVLVKILQKHKSLLKETSNTFEKFEVYGTVEAMQGKKKVDGIYFSSVIPKPKDCRFYFYPSYTHLEELDDIPEVLKKCKKGKSCYYIKKLDDDMVKALKDLVAKAVKLYQRDGLLKK